MAKLWHPDTCKDGQCILETAPAQAALIKIERLCPHHAAMGLDGDKLFAAIFDTNTTKNLSTYEASKVLQVEHAAVPWRIDPLDRVVIAIDPPSLQAVTAAIESRIGVGRVLFEVSVGT